MGNKLVRVFFACNKTLNASIYDLSNSRICVENGGTFSDTFKRESESSTDIFTCLRNPSMLRFGYRLSTVSNSFLNILLRATSIIFIVETDTALRTIRN